MRQTLAPLLASPCLYVAACLLNIRFDAVEDETFPFILFIVFHTVSQLTSLCLSRHRLESLLLAEPSVSSPRPLRAGDSFILLCSCCIANMTPCSQRGSILVGRIVTCTYLDLPHSPSSTRHGSADLAAQHASHDIRPRIWLTP